MEYFVLILAIGGVVWIVRKHRQAIESPGWTPVVCGDDGDGWQTRIADEDDDVMSDDDMFDDDLRYSPVYDHLPGNVFHDMYDDFSPLDD